MRAAAMTAAAMAGRRRIRVLDTCDVLAHEVAVIPAEFDARQPVHKMKNFFLDF